MLPFLISILYTISIIVATYGLILYRKTLLNYKYILLTLMGSYSLGKWLLLKVPEIKIMVGVSFGDSLLFGLLLFGFILLPFFRLLEKNIEGNELSQKENKQIFILYILFLVFHSVPEAIQLGYQYTFGMNGSLGEVVKAIVEEIPEFIMLLGIYIMITGKKKESIILGILTGLLFPVTTLLVSIFANNSNAALEMMMKNVLLGFYIIFGVMVFNILLKYNRKYLILFIGLIVLLEVYKSIIGI